MIVKQKDRPSASLKDLSDPARRKKSEEEVYEGIVSLLGKTRPNALSGLPIEERKANLALLRSQGYSIRQIERATGISRGIVLIPCYCPLC